jgi:uncharacterized membrane protein (UPF0127 family)
VARVIPRRRSPGLARAVVVLLLLGGLAGGACKNSAGQRQTAASAPGGAAPATVVVDASDGKVAFHVEVARTPTQHERGLMYRRYLAPDAGMIFVFERELMQTFWMKNTFIPLDMIFISADRRIVGIVANAEPQTETVRAVEAPSQYVLEIGGGVAAKDGLRAGQRVEFQGVE